MWKDIKGYEGIYQISDNGDIKSLNRFDKAGHNLKELIRKQKVTKFGYKNITLYKDGKRKEYFVHRLVAYTFIGMPKGKKQVNHKNGNKIDNRVENLEWVTVSENHKHMYRTGLRSMEGEHHNNRKVNAKQAIEIFKSREKGVDLAKKYGVTTGTISLIRRSKNWTSVTSKL